MSEPIKCPFCGGPHHWQECRAVFTPIKGCKYKDPCDGTCDNRLNTTPECHVDACPLLDPRVSEGFKPDLQHKPAPHNDAAAGERK